jgi:dodecin
VAGGVYKLIELVGTSTESWEAAAKAALDAATATLQDIRIAEVVKMDVRLESNKVVEYRVRLMVSFKYHKDLGD